MSELIDAYDAALFDLDGVIYLGPEVVPGAAEGIADLHQRGVRVGFVTNNAAREPSRVAQHLTEIGIEATADDVVTSAQAGARMLAEQLPVGSTVLVCGAAALASEVEAVGMRVITEGVPDAVIQGYDPQMIWPRLDQACYAIQAGARWFATNTDATRPTDKGLVPGAGAQINAVQLTVDVKPQVAGKPCPPLLNETIRRLGSRHPIFIGDRIDTDIMGANAVGMDSMFVFTGAHGKAHLLAAGPTGRPSAIGFNLRALTRPGRSVRLDAGTARCDEQIAHLVNGSIRLDRVPSTRDEQLDALWAVLNLAWRTQADAAEALDQLTLLP